MFPFPNLMPLLSMCGGDWSVDIPGVTRSERAPVVDLGTVADDQPDAPEALVDPDNHDDCAIQTVGVQAVGPRTHDPTDPDTVISITIQATIPGEASGDVQAYLCGVSANKSTTDIWIVRQADDCTDPKAELPGPPWSFGATTELPGWLTVCLQSSSPYYPFTDLIQIYTNDQADPRSFMVSGPS